MPSFTLAGRNAVVTGATGAIGSALAHGLGEAGARVALIARGQDGLDRVSAELAAQSIAVQAFSADVRDPAQLRKVRDAVVSDWGSVDILVNVAGGNIATATVADAASPFDLRTTALQHVLELNLMSAVSATTIFGPALATSPSADRAILNVSSMAASRAMTRVGGYGAAKAALENMTRWFAVELARREVGIRVNAIAPGFLLGEQNRSLLLDPDGELSSRGRTIIAHTPLRRFGDPDELVGAAVWLCGPAARFVTGIVVPVDGGFSAFSGV